MLTENSKLSPNNGWREIRDLESLQMVMAVGRKDVL